MIFKITAVFLLAGVGSFSLSGADGLVAELSVRHQCAGNRVARLLVCRVFDTALVAGVQPDGDNGHRFLLPQSERPVFSMLQLLPKVNVFRQVPRDIAVKLVEYHIVLFERKTVNGILPVARDAVHFSGVHHRADTVHFPL